MDDIIYARCFSILHKFERAWYWYTIFQFEGDTEPHRAEGTAPSEGAAFDDIQRVRMEAYASKAEAQQE